METLYLYTGFALCLIANALIMRGFAWLLTEWRRPLVPVKPFNCRPCLTFWLTLAGGAYMGGVSVMSYDWRTYVPVVTFAFLNYVIINSKYSINE